MNNSTQTFPLISMLLKVLWIIVILTAAFFVYTNAIQYFGFDPEVFGRYWPHKFILIGHVGGGILALAIGPFQFSSKFRNKYLHIHRTIGKVYILAIVVGSLCALSLALTVAMEVHWTWAYSLIGLAFAWIVCVLMAFRSIKLKRITIHKEWMIRSYIVTFGFVTFRILNDYLMVDFGNFVERAPSIAWMAWTIPLLIGEVCIQWNKK